MWVLPELDPSCLAMTLAEIAKAPQNLLFNKFRASIRRQFC